jgi:outer membrane protein OmpA-like peptidoglycan-associated protein
MDRVKSGSQRNAVPMLLLAGMTLGLTGCAADGGSPFGLVATEEWVRNYVREQNAPIQANVKEVDSRVTKVDTRITQVDARVTQADAQTKDARQVADEAVRKADAVNSRVTQALADRQKRTLVESASLQFASGRFALEPDHKKVLDGVSEKLTTNPTYTVDVVGQADAQGTKQDNGLLSWRRTEHVRRYLAEKGGVLHRISFIGLGEDMAQESARQEHRQVTVVIFRPVAE